MSERAHPSPLSRAYRSQLAAALSAWLLLAGIARAQTPPSAARLVFPVSALASDEALRGAVDRDASSGVRRITLKEAQQLAVQTDNPLVRLGQFQVEAAEQHRLGVKAMYFPNVSGQFENLHFNKHPGEIFTVQRPLAGTILSVPTNIIEQDQTAVNFSVVQPLTPLFAVRQLVRIARADENIARAKAGMPVAERASLVEKTYFDLLVAERHLAGAAVEARNVQARWMTVGSPSATRVAADQQLKLVSTAKSLSLAETTVRQLTASMNEMLGLPAGTRLELIPPEPLVEHLSLADAIGQAGAASTDVIEAEQTAVKAHAGSRLAKMEYFPSIAIVGGYAHQSAINVVLPEDFAYVGVIATYTIFDSFKRERGVKERSAQVQAAELAVQLNRAKTASAVKTSYLELERARELVQLVRRMAPAPRVVAASYVSDRTDVDAAQVGIETELLRAELEYRQAYARVKSLMGQ